MPDSSSDRNPVEILAEEFVDRQRRGEKPTLSEYTARYPELAAEIRDLFPALLMMEDLGDSSLASTGPHLPAVPALCQLGEYRILREVGRGGMGVVYEAEQESLGRRVALKVLPRQALNHSTQILRFEREARAAAKLHHTNIVPVFGVGHQDATHYYVMQFIQGLGLDGVLEELRRLRAGKARHVTRPTVPARQPAGGVPSPANQVAQSLLTGSFHWDGPSSAANGVEAQSTVTKSASESAVPRLPDGSDLSSVSETDTRYCRSVARIGVQVAEALDYAHGQGILHRDIKPSNLLMDMKGTVWVTDFGLAKGSDAEDLTHAGDIIGTVRYMAPERFQGRGDARSDVYSLGLTLYELLALRPAFDQRERPKLIEQLLHEEPPRLRKLNPAVPRDLETIVQKAIAKEPERRYGGAADLGADLQCFLDDRPIQARPVRSLERFGRWCRRNPLPAGLAVAVALSLLLGTIASGMFALRAIESAERADAKANDAEKEAARADAEAGRAQERADAEAMAHRKADEALRETKHTLAISNFQRAVAAFDRNKLPQALERLFAIPAEERSWEWRYLRNLCEGGLFTLHGHTDPILQVIYSPDGRYLVSTSFIVQNNFSGQGIVLLNLPQQSKVWDTRTGEGLYTLAGSKAPAQAIAFSPDGSTFASRCHDGMVRLWDPSTGRVVFSFPVNAEPTTKIAFSPDGQRLAAGCKDKTVRVWDAKTGEQLVQLEGHAEIPRDIVFSPDGLRLLSRAQRREDRLDYKEDNRQLGPGELKVWDLKTKGSVVNLTHVGFAPRGVFSADGKRLTTVDDSRRVAVWDLEAGRELNSSRLNHGPSNLDVLGLSADGQYIITYDLTYDGSNDRFGHLIIWEAATGRHLWTFSGHAADVTCFAFSPDGVYLATGSRDNTIRTWDLLHGKESLTLRGHTNQVFGVAFSPDGQHLVSGSQDWTVKVWDARNPPGTYTIWQGGSELAFSPDGQHLATGWADVNVLDVGSGQKVFSVPREFSFQAKVVYSADGKFVASTSGSGALVCNARTGQEVIHLDYPVDKLAPMIHFTQNGVPMSNPMTKYVTCVAFSPDGQRLATGSWVGLGEEKTAPEVSIWDLATRRVLFTLRGQAGSVNCAVFSPDGKTLAFVSGNLIHVFDLTTQQVIFTLPGHNFDIKCLAFSPDGRWLASGSDYDRTVVLWDAHSRKKVWTQRGQKWLGHSASFSKDGQRLVSIGRQIRGNFSEMTVFDVGTGQELLTFNDSDLDLECAAFSPDGRKLAAGGKKTLRVLEAPEITERLVINLRSDPEVGLVFSPDGQRLAIATLNQSIWIVDTRTGQTQIILTGMGRISVNMFGRYHVRLSFSPDGKRLASASMTGTQIWDLETGKVLQRLPGGTDVAFNRDGTMVAGSTFSGQARVWDTATGKELHALQLKAGLLKRLAFNGEGTQLLTWNTHGEKAAWDLKTGKKLTGEPRAEDMPPEPYMSPDRKRLARVNGDQVILEDLTPITPDERSRRSNRTARDPNWDEQQKTDLNAVRYAMASGEAFWGRKLAQCWKADLWHLDQLIRDRPDDLSLRMRRGEALAELDRWREAQAEYALVTEKTTAKPGAISLTKEAQAWNWLAQTQLAEGQTEAYRRTCAQMLRRYGLPALPTQLNLALSTTPANVYGQFSLLTLHDMELNSKNPLTWLRVEAVQTCLLQGGAVADPAALLLFSSDRSNEVLQGTVLCRAGKHAEAARVLGGYVTKYRKYDQIEGLRPALFYLAIAEHHQGRTTEARQALKEAVQWLDAIPTYAVLGSDAGPESRLSNAEAIAWNQRLEYQLLRREVEALLAKKPPAAGK